MINNGGGDVVVTLAPCTHLTRHQVVMTQEEQFGQILTLLSQNSKGISELKSSMNEMTKAKEEIEAWKPEVDNRMAILETAVTNLGEHVEYLIGFHSPSA